MRALGPHNPNAATNHPNVRRVDPYRPDSILPTYDELTSARPLSFRGTRSQGRPLWGVEVDVPGTTLNHRLEQTIFFDKEGFLRRHDYAFGVVGWWASVAELFEDYVEVGGLAVARRRRVIGRLGRFELGRVAFEMTFDDVTTIPAVEPGRPRLSLV